MSRSCQKVKLLSLRDHVQRLVSRFIVGRLCHTAYLNFGETLSNHKIRDSRGVVCLCGGAVSRPCSLPSSESVLAFVLPNQSKMLERYDNVILNIVALFHHA